ncbi:MAG: nitrogenase molybdenum-iron protein, alpha and beta chain [Clostridiales Family XIII bacterium]|jgi:nitrogenase molybdenum-iron protein beta chain|nr:nitrogenase molybdenum-iron protein, alpha and beta chain [Clostridiales Family XIII bacterium]
MSVKAEITSCVEQPRIACAIGGIYTALAIDRVLPILHAGPGCQGQAGATLAGANGGQNADTYLESVIPSTNFSESDVVFGAAERLSHVVEESLKYYDADMFIVSDGCVSQIVGDDIEEVVRTFEGREKPVLHASLPGFKGNNLFGHSEILKAIVEQYLTKSDHVNEKQVNVWGIVPFYDTFWVATLEKLEALLTELGFEPNIIYGHGKGLKAVDKIPSAGFNLLISPWVDLDIVKLLEEKFDTPYFHYPNIPIGPTQTADFVRKLVKYANLDEVGAERIIKREEDRYYYYLNHSIKFIFTCRVTPREFYINSSASQALALTKYLINDLGMTPRKIFISEGVPEELQEEVRSYFNDVQHERPEDLEVIFTNDGGLCDTYVKSEDTTFRKTAVFGTTWDELTAKNLKLPFVPVSAPAGDLMVGVKTYFAWEGAINLAADLYNDAANKGLGTVS